MEKEQFLKNVLNSVDGMSKVVPKEDLFFKIEKKIAFQRVVPMQTMWLVAASIVALIFLNIALLTDVSKSNQSQISSLENFLNKSNQLYK